VSLYIGYQIGRKRLLSLEGFLWQLQLQKIQRTYLPVNQALIFPVFLCHPVYKSQPLTNLNTNEIFSIHRHEVTNKNDDINNLFKI